MKIYQIFGYSNGYVYIKWLPTKDEAEAWVHELDEGIDEEDIDEMGNPTLIEELDLPTTPKEMCELVNDIIDAAANIRTETRNRWAAKVECAVSRG